MVPDFKSRQPAISAKRVSRLLTRARQLWSSTYRTGYEHDASRSPSFYDATYHYLTQIGIPQI